MTNSARSRVPRVTPRRLLSGSGACDRREVLEGREVVEGSHGGDALGCSRARRGGRGRSARRRPTLLRRRPAPRGAAKRRAPHPIRVHDRRVDPPRTRHGAGARPRATAGGARACARPRANPRIRFRRSQCARRPLARTLCARAAVSPYAAATRWGAAAASTSAASRSPPSAHPRSGSTACSGCGISPITFPASFTTAATFPSEPFTSSV